MNIFNSSLDFTITSDITEFEMIFLQKNPIDINKYVFLIYHITLT